jgi:ABC-type sugar transport system ATPase subunit
VVESLGPEALVYWSMHGKRFCARIPGDCSIKHGDLLRLVPDMKNSHLFDQETGERLN